MRYSNGLETNHCDTPNSRRPKANEKDLLQNSWEIPLADNLEGCRHLFHTIAAQTEPEATYRNIIRVGLAGAAISMGIGVIVFSTTLPTPSLYLPIALLISLACIFIGSFLVKQNRFAKNSSYQNGKADLESEIAALERGLSLRPVCESEKYMELESFH